MVQTAALRTHHEAPAAFNGRRLLIVLNTTLWNVFDHQGPDVTQDACLSLALWISRGRLWLTGTWSASLSAGVDMLWRRRRVLPHVHPERPPPLFDCGNCGQKKKKKKPQHVINHVRSVLTAIFILVIEPVQVIGETLLHPSFFNALAG